MVIKIQRPNPFAATKSNRKIIPFLWKSVWLKTLLATTEKKINLKIAYKNQIEIEWMYLYRANRWRKNASTQAGRQPARQVDIRSKMAIRLWHITEPHNQFIWFAYSLHKQFIKKRKSNICTVSGNIGEHFEFAYRNWKRRQI